MLTIAMTLTLALVNASPSASTLAAVAIFAANVDRQWPTDEREPVVTGEALRLMAVAARGMADDWKVDDGKVRDSIAAFESASEALAQQAGDDRQRAEMTRKVLDEGRQMIERLAVALNSADLTATGRAGLKKAVDDFDKKKPVPQQADQLEQYFQQAAKLLRAIVDQPTPLT
jgi:hypothetical protein